MLLIFGTKVRQKVLQALVFACPNCRTDRPGALVLMRRWFTLFFIPIVPLDKLGQIVRCDHCKGTFRPEVLDRPTVASTGATHTDAVRALGALLVGAGDPASTPARAQAVATIGSLVPGYVDDTLTTDLQVLDPAHAAGYAAPLNEAYDPAAKERFLGDLVRVATADGEPTARQLAMLEEIGRSLGLSSAHVAGVVATAGTTRPPVAGPTWPPRPTAPGEV